MNYYNEIDPYCAQWIRNLMDDDLIPRGHVDTRSIEDVTPADLSGYDQCHFFAGIAGWALALRMAGIPDDYPIWTGSCPCQPFSAAGKGAGFDDERHLWPAFHWIIQQSCPAIVVGEQVAGSAIGAWIDLVFDDLEGLGYACGAYAGPAAGVGAKHIRQRSYWAATSNAIWDEQSREESRIRTSGRVGRVVKSVSWDRDWQSSLSGFRALGDGLPRSVGATDAARNAIVPQQAAEFLRALIVPNLHDTIPPECAIPATGSGRV